MKLLRTTMAFVGGLLAAGAVVAVWEAVAHAALAGPGRFAAIALGYGAASVVGSATGVRLGGKWTGTAVVLALAALAVINLLAFPHPSWFAVLATAAMAAGLGSGLAVGRAWARRNGRS